MAENEFSLGKGSPKKEETARELGKRLAKSAKSLYDRHVAWEAGLLQMRGERYGIEISDDEAVRAGEILVERQLYPDKWEKGHEPGKARE